MDRHAGMGAKRPAATEVWPADRSKQWRRIAVAIGGLALLACGSREPPPHREEMDLSTAELRATPFAQRMFDEDQLSLFADATPLYGEAPLLVHFRVLVIDEADKPTYWWDFGDGTAPSNERSPHHQYEDVGNYTATLRIIDRDNKVGVADVEIAVFPPDE